MGVAEGRETRVSADYYREDIAVSAYFSFVTFFISPCFCFDKTAVSACYL